jgi:hypothetical protein
MQAPDGIGAEGFHDRLAEAQQASADGELIENSQDDRLEDIMGDFALAGAGGAAGLVPIPQATQAGGEQGVVDPSTRTARKAKLSADHREAQSKSVALKNLWARQIMLEENAGPNPFTVFGAVWNSINSMADDDPQKAWAIEMINTVTPIFEASRKNPTLRSFLAELFPAQEKYYATKAEKLELTTDISILTELYNEQEMQMAMVAVKRVQDEREAAIKEKARKKVERDNERAERKEEASKRQKTGK